MLPDVFPTLCTERLQLRQLTTDDAQDVLEVFAFNKENPTVECAVDKINTLSSTFKKKEGVTWAIIFQNELVGTVGFYRGFNNDTGEIGYVLKSKFKRLGIMSEASVCVMKFAFERVGVEKITAFTGGDNSPSIKMLHSLGFIPSTIPSDKYSVFEISKESFFQKHQFNNL